MRAPLTLLMPLLLLQSCAGSPVARQLEGSFSRSEQDQRAKDSAEPVVPGSEAEDGSGREPELEAAVPAPVNGNGPSDQQRIAGAGTPASAQPLSPTEMPLPSSTRQLKPYRITIRLSAADPAAPAEAVTQALRKAQIPFSVERIERIQSDGEPAAAGAASSTP